MKRRERRIDWRSRPAKRMIGADFSITFRIRLDDAFEMSRLLSAMRIPKEEFAQIDKIALESVPLHYSTAVLDRARMHRLVADGLRIPSDVLFARSRFLFREAGVGGEE